MLSLSLAQLRAHSSRLAATVLAIVIAVGFVVATLVLNQTSRATVYRAVAAPYVGSDVVITGDQLADQLASQPADHGLVEQVRTVPGVAAVAGDRSNYLEFRPPGGGTRLGRVTSIADPGPLRWQALTAGRLPATDGEVAISPIRGARIGSTISVLLRPPGDQPASPVLAQLRVTGLVDLDLSVAAATDQLYLPAATALAWRFPLEAVRVQAAPGVRPGDLAARVRAALDRAALDRAALDRAALDRAALDRAATGPALVVRTGEQEAAARADASTGGAAGITTVLLVFATVSVFVCGLVIANTFAVLLAQRTRELALLRAVGATGRQLRRGVLLESLLTGLVAAALGVGAGIGMAGLISLLAQHLDSPIPLSGLSVPLSAVLIGIGVGTLVTLAAAYLPARRATRVAPLAALRPLDPPPLRTRAGLARRLAGLVLLVPGAIVLGAGAARGQLLVAMAGGLVSFVAVVLLARWVVPPAVRLVGRLGARAGGVPGLLAASNSVRNPQRTAATATALIVGVTLTTTMVVGAASTRSTAAAGLDRAFPTDVVVQSSTGRPLAAGVPAAVAKLPDVRAAVGLTGATVQGPGLGLPVLGIDAARVAAVVRSAAGAGVPTPGTVSVPSNLAGAWGADGQPVTLSVGHRKVTLRIHVVGSDTPASMAAADLARLAPRAGLAAVWVRLADGLDREGRAAALTAIGAAAPGGSLRGAAQERDGFDRIVNTLLLIVTGLLAVAVVIAVIGVGNTIALSVLERRQESGLLRALGLTRRQLRWMLLWEAVLIAGVASLLGVLLGTVYGVLGTSAALISAAPLTVTIPWLQVAAIVLVATAAGALASVLPARRAARTSPVAAIA